MGEKTALRYIYIYFRRLKHAERILYQLRQQGDELETRQAWLEELAENTICPVCDGEIKLSEKDDVYRLICSINGEHLFWP